MTALGHRFWRMYGATASSDLADGIGRTALPLAAASYTRDPVIVSGLLTFAFLPWLLFALPSGALVDRTDRRYAMAVANLVRALAVGVLSLLLVLHVGNVAVLYVVAFVLGAAETVYDSAVRALLPQVVARQQLDRANSLVTVEEALGQTFLGAPLGSALFAVAAALPFLLNGIGFLIAVGLILSMRGGSYRPRRVGRTSVRTDMAEGVRWLRGHRLLRGLTLISAGTAFAQTIGSGVLVLYVLEVLHLPPADFGLILVAGGIGGILGALATPRLARRFGRRAVLVVGGMVDAIAIAALAATDNGFLAAALFGLVSAGVMTWNVLTMSLRQALIPEALFGRVQGAYRTLVWGVIPLGSLAGGVLADHFGLRAVFVIAGALLFAFACALAVLLHRHEDELADLPDDVTPRSESVDAAPVSASAAT
jgi:MFS family permease